MRLTLSFVVALLTGASAFAADEKSGEKVTYEDHVKPIFRQHCFNCHNTDRKVGGLDLTSYINMMQGGSSGTAVEPGDSSSSYLFMLVNHDSEPTMPPNQEKIAAAKIDTLRKWIDGGALENSGSKPIARKKKQDVALMSVSIGKPSGPPPMPEKLVLDPVVHTEQTTAVTALATNPWSTLIAVGGPKQVVLYDANSLALIGVLPFPEGEPKVLKFSRNGGLLLAGGGKGAYSGKVVLWNVRTGERVIEVGDELDTVLAADISADQSMVALGGPQRIVRVYSTSDGSLKYELKKHTDWVTSIAFSPDGVLLTTGDRNGGIFAWEAMTGLEYLSLTGHKGCITGIAWRADSNVVASGSEDGQIRLWEVMDGKNIKTWTAHGGGVQSVEFCRDGQLVSAGRDKVAKLWDQNGKQIRAYPAFRDIALSVTYSDDAKRVIAGDWTGQIKVWTAENGQEVGELTANPPTLEQRLQSAQATFNGQKAEADKLEAAAKAAEAEVAKVKAAQAAAQKTATEMQAKLDASNKMANDLQAAMGTMKTQIDAANKTATDLQPIVSPLSEAYAKAEEAAKKAPADKELAAALAALKTQLDKNAGAMAAAKKTATDQTAAMQKATTDEAAAKKAAQDATAALATAKQTIDQLTKQLEPLAKKAQESRGAADAGKKTLVEATKEVTRWQTEIQFRDERKKLVEAKTKAEEAVAVSEQAAAELKQVQTDLTAAQAKVAETQKAIAATEAVIAAAQKSVADSSAAVGTAKKTVEQMTELVKSTQTTATAAAESLKKSPEDAGLKDLVAKANAVHQGKQQALGTATQAMQQAEEAVKKAQAQLQTAEAKQKTLAATLTELQKTTTEITVKVQAAQTKATMAKTAADQAQATVQTLQKTVDELIQKVAPKAEVASAK